MWLKFHHAISFIRLLIQKKSSDMNNTSANNDVLFSGFVLAQNAINSEIEEKINIIARLLVFDERARAHQHRKREMGDGNKQ